MKKGDTKADGRRRGQRHGDARNALLQAAAELVETTGAAGLALRQVAEHAGLSRQAPYNHFADKEAMLAELVCDGFAQLATAVRASAGGSTGEAALVAAGEAYIGFSERSPALFRLMFSRELVDPGKFPNAASAGNDAFDTLRDVVSTFAPMERVDDLSFAAWCMIHGYATLILERGLGDRPELSKRATTLARIIVASTQSELD